MVPFNRSGGVPPFASVGPAGRTGEVRRWTAPSEASRRDIEVVNWKRRSPAAAKGRTRLVHSIDFVANPGAPAPRLTGRPRGGVDGLITRSPGYLHTVRTGPEVCRRKFLEHFPGGFSDETYLAWERGYKWDAHRLWVELVGGKAEFRRKLDLGRHDEVASAAVRIESSRQLLFSFEKMALRDAVLRSDKGAVLFADGLYDWLHGPGGERSRFERWLDVVRELPRTKTRVATWPVITVFGMIARPKVHCYLKPLTTKRAAAAYGFDFAYSSRPSWDTYGSLLELCRTVRDDMADLGPRDQIDIQSFLWVNGSDEYD